MTLEERALEQKFVLAAKLGFTDDVIHWSNILKELREQK